MYDHGTVPYASPGTRFMTPKISMKFEWVTPAGGTKYRWVG